MHIEVRHPSWLVASGDHERLEVARSPLVRQRHRIYREVRQHIADHGLVLAARESFADPNFMHGEVEASVYVTPLARNAGAA